MNIKDLQNEEAMQGIIEMLELGPALVKSLAPPVFESFKQVSPELQQLIKELITFCADTHQELREEWHRVLRGKVENASVIYKEARELGFGPDQAMEVLKLVYDDKASIPCFKKEKK